MFIQNIVIMEAMKLSRTIRACKNIFVITADIHSTAAGTEEPTCTGPMGLSYCHHVNFCTLL